MNLSFDISLASGYKSNSQKIRVLSENWVPKNLYCPSCGKSGLSDFNNNQPVADFYCTYCNEEFELKSSSRPFGKKVVDGAYDSMISRITAKNNPNFLFLVYNANSYSVTSVFLIPKHFIIPRVIQKRNPLDHSARRAGWVGCNILVSEVPALGKIEIIDNSEARNVNEISDQWQKSLFMREMVSEANGWLMDIIQCIETLGSHDFTLADMYRFENELSLKYPENSNIKPKIRQQLQILRSKGLIQFMGSGNYHLL